MCGKEYDLIHRKRWQNTRPHSVQKKNRALSTGGFGVYLFFFMAPQVMRKKGRRLIVGEEPSARKVFIFHGIIIIHYLLKKQGDYNHE